jgi:hypothetical protein
MMSSESVVSCRTFAPSPMTTHNATRRDVDGGVEDGLVNLMILVLEFRVLRVIHGG